MTGGIPFTKFYPELLTPSERPRTELKDKDDSMSFNASIFYNKHPLLLNEIVPQQNTIHLRSKNQEMLATQGFLSPHLHHSRLKYLTDLSEFSGSNIVIKDLNKLRNKDVLKISTDMAQPLEVGERPLSREDEDRITTTLPSAGPTSTIHRVSTLRS